MRKLETTAILAGLLAASLSAQAQTPPPTDKPAEPAAQPMLSIAGFDLTGHVDVGYTSLRGSGKFASGLNSRVFDFDRNEVSLHAVDLQLANLPESGFGGLFDLTLGKDADTIAAYGTINKSRGPANGVDKRADVTQAFLHFGAGALTLIAGKYVTLSGAEVIKSAGDTNYSRSILFGYAIPFTHSGVRATYKLSDTLTLVGGVNQGWDVFEDPNSDKTLELQAAITPAKTLSILVTGYSGKERVTNYPKSDANGKRNLLDIVATCTAMDPLTLILNVDYGTQEGGGANGGKAKWQGVAGYANYQFNDEWRLSLRAEYFDDKDGYRTGLIQKWKEATATLAYLLNKNFELRVEVREDRSSTFAFLKENRTTVSNTERSFGVEALYKF
ncbi:MAG: outer membrane beta-barrel protein [Burkholderiales bacterium]